MAWLVFLATLLASTVAYAATTTDIMTVSFRCDNDCSECSNKTVFTPKTTDDTCTAKGEDFSYKAVCKEDGEWSLKTFQGKECKDANAVYNFNGGKNENCKEHDKTTSVKYVSTEQIKKLKLKVCILGDADKCSNMEDCQEVEVTDAATCEAVEVSTKTYFFTMKETTEGSARAAKPAAATTTISVYGTKTECESEGLPLAYYKGAAEGSCHHEQQRVKVVCPVTDMTVKHGCTGDNCDNCPRTTMFTPKTTDECQEGTGFSFKAMCKENGEWKLETFQGTSCDSGKDVFSFSGNKENKCKLNEKITSVKYESVSGGNINLKMCVLETEDKCAANLESCKTAAVSETANCEAFKVGEDADKMYYFKVTAVNEPVAGARAAKAAEEETAKKFTISVYGSEYECKHNGLPLVHWEKATKEQCHAEKYRVEVECPATKDMTVEYGCTTDGCESCPMSTTFTPTGDDQCQDKGDSFSYKATCKSGGEWSLKTFQGKNCESDKAVYAFSGMKNENCKQHAKTTSVQYASTEQTTNLKLKVCVLGEGDKCSTMDACPDVTVPDNAKCQGIKVGESDKKYFTVSKETAAASAVARAAKPAAATTTISVYGTKEECTNNGLPLAHWLRATEGQCHAEQQRVKVECPAKQDTPEKPEETTASTTSSEGEGTAKNTTTPTSTEKDTTSATSTYNTEEDSNSSNTSTNDTSDSDDVAAMTTLLAIFATAAAMLTLF